MIDFVKISTRNPKQGILEIYPKFIVGTSKDLMIRGGDFYAVWIEENGLWSTNEQDVIDLIDRELDIFADGYRQKYDGVIKIQYMWDADTGIIDKWHKYCQKQCRDNFHMLDEKLIFSDSKPNKKDYASKRLPYPLQEGPYPAFEKIISTLYTPEERTKIEWAIGAIITGDSKKIQKFMVLYGAAGTGKSTILNIIQMLFEGYYSVFDAKALGSASNAFALEAFKCNPLVAIQHDGDLSRIEDNTRLNSLVSHELMTVNEKFKSTYSSRFKAFLLMGTNKPVKITDGKSGLLRRLIDVTPSGEKLTIKEYRECMKQIPFELGAIACHCRDLYLEDPGRYDDYVPTNMMEASNDFYNFVVDSYSVFLKEDGTTLKAAWEMYKTYCDDAKVPYPMSQRNFREELKNYFWEFEERKTQSDGSRLRSVYSGFRTDIFDADNKAPKRKNKEIKINSWLDMKEQQHSSFDDICKGCLAQYATAKETPKKAWSEVTTTLADISTDQLHYVKVPENHIVIDFDLKNEKGEKDYALNLAAANSWPPTYAEVSKGGSGIHLHYLYSGDASKLSRLFDTDIEIKVFTGKSSLRRKLSKCNALTVATISSGLPIKEEDKMISKEVVQTEKGIRTTIEKCMRKEVHSGTKPNVDFIYKILDDAYKSGIHYDVSDMRNQVIAFAASSTNNAEYCLKLTKSMKWMSEDAEEAAKDDSGKPIAFYDIEVFPNLFLVNWKIEGEGHQVVRMINPSPADIEDLISEFRLVGFNCRRYDNHILYYRLIGKDIPELYEMSSRIVNAQKGDGNTYLKGEAYNISYTDVYDFAAKKQSLKKWEIELGIHHQELGLPWNEPVPEEMWQKVAEYCDNDVIATEAVWNHLKGDFTARQILADLAGGTVNDTTNSLTTKIIFGKEKHPNLVYTNLEETFPGYEFKEGHNMYRETDVGFGGYVYAQPGMYGNVALLDVASMHPASIIAMNCFGDYTKNFADIRQARIYIKRKEFDKAREMLNGKLAPYLDDESVAKNLAQALKIAINSVYGLTSASFDNPFRDIRNKNNIVALRGALFMRTLQDEVTARGFTVVHIKTDSIKIADANQDIIDFCMDFARKYGYEFEHEATYDRMCIVNDAVYIAKYADGAHEYELPTGEKVQTPWTATGKQFMVPYLFKSLFSKTPIVFRDMCETFAVQKGDLYLDFNEKLPDVSEEEKQLKKLEDQYKKGQLSDTTFEQNCKQLNDIIETGHSYQFVGRVGQFTPLKPGTNGGILYRVNEGKYYAAPGSTGYRWRESEDVKRLGKEDCVDISFYNNLIDDAIEAIAKYGDFEWFVSDDPYIGPLETYIYKDCEEEIPWDKGIDKVKEK